MEILNMFFQLILLLIFAPFFDGYARKIRAKYQSRIGVPIYQTYLDLYKLISRYRTMPDFSNPIFIIVPFLLFALSATMFCALPIMYNGEILSKFSNIFVILYLGAFFRFVFAIVGVDSANPFAGIGSSREVMMGIYVEPVIILSLCVIMFGTGSSSLIEIKNSILKGDFGYFTPSFAISCIAFAWAMYIELGRKPYDLAEAEQELQEAVLSEYSGRDLALIQISMIIKQFTMIGFLLILFLPFNFSNPFINGICFILLAGILYILAIFIDNFSARFKIANSVNFSIAIALIIAFIATLLFILGV